MSSAIRYYTGETIQHTHDGERLTFGCRACSLTAKTHRCGACDVRVPLTRDFCEDHKRNKKGVRHG